MRRTCILTAAVGAAVAAMSLGTRQSHAVPALRFDINSDNLMEAANPDAGYSPTQGLNDDNTESGIPSPPFDPWFINGGRDSPGGDPRLNAFVFVDSTLQPPFTPHYPGTRVQITAASGDVLDSVRRFGMPGETSTYFYNRLYRDCMFNTNLSANYDPGSAQAGMHTAADGGADPNAQPHGPMNINVGGLAASTTYAVTLYTYDKWMDLDTAGVGQSVGVSRFRFTDATPGNAGNTGISAEYGRNGAPGGLTNDTWAVTMLVKSTAGGTIVLNNEALNDFGGSGNTLRSAILNGVEINVLPTQWTGTAGSNYSDGGNWSSGSPNGTTQGAFNNQIAYFGASSNHTVTMNAPATLSQVVFDDANSYTINGGSTLTVSGGGVSALLGNHTISAPVTATGQILNFSVAGGSRVDLTGLVTVNDATLSVPNAKLLRGVINKEGLGAAALSKIKSSIVTINAGSLAVRTNGASSNVSNVGTIIITTNASNQPIGTLDLNDNDLIVGTRDISGNPVGTTKGTVVSLVSFARNAGAWDRGGIGSTAAKTQVDHVTTLGVMDGQEYHGVAGGGAQFDGQNVGNTDVLIKYTYYGDSDFSGKVDGADYARIDTTFNNQVTTVTDIGGWVNGDSDFSGKIDGGDYALIDAAFNAQGNTVLRMLSFLDGTDPDRNTMTGAALSQVLRHYDQFGESYALAALNNVPEPSALALAGALWLGLPRRRRAR